MANFVVDRGADAFGKAFIVERRRDGAMGYRKVMHQRIDFLGTHSHMDMGGNIVQHSGVDGGAGSNAFQLFYRADCFKVWHFKAFQSIGGHLGVCIEMTFFIF